MAELRREQGSELPKFNYSQMKDQIDWINKSLVSPLTVSSRKQSSFTTKYVMELIRFGFDHISAIGYNFTTNTSKKGFYDHEAQSNLYVIKRVLKLGFKCKNNRCPDFLKNSAVHKERKWTSYYGLTQFTMYFDKDEVLRYNLKIYGQRCTVCKEYGSGLLVQQAMENLVDLYGIILQIILNLSQDRRDGIKLDGPQRDGLRQTGNRKDKKGIQFKHRQNQCEACLYNKCYYDKTKQPSKQRRKRR